MNRLGPGLAIGAGYVLGRTKKTKLALAADKRLHLSPRALAYLVNNPHFEEAGDQLDEAPEIPALGRGPSRGDADAEIRENSAPPAFEERGLGRSPRWGSPRSSEAESGGGTGRGGGGEKPRSVSFGEDTEEEPYEDEDEERATVGGSRR
ncbi:hypothetical protein [Streptomyces tailanensis]|uniref:hypothetical protein n=1 Tax=Streptomyces tailanensis TaxID=2569858 RepID=UPI00122E6554|nr:hypothetical protein [Streptomyces tailanensis]